MVTPKTGRDAIKFQNFLNRNEATDLLGCSTATLINWERKGLLHPVMGTQGDSTREVYLYDPAELARLPRKRAAPLTPGEAESRAFEMFERGLSVRRVVIDLRITADEAWAIRERWLDSGNDTDGKPKTTRETKREIEFDAEHHANASDAEIEDGIEAALDAAEPGEADAG